VVQFVDPGHYWFDPKGLTFHIWMRAHTGGAGYAAVAKVVERAHADGSMVTMLEKVPSGKTALFLPCPGGQMRFHVLSRSGDARAKNAHDGNLITLLVWHCISTGGLLKSRKGRSFLPVPS